MTKWLGLLLLVVSGVASATPLTDLRLFYTPEERAAIDAPTVGDPSLPTPDVAGWVRSPAGRSEFAPGDRGGARSGLAIRAAP